MPGLAIEITLGMFPVPMASAQAAPSLPEPTLSPPEHREDPPDCYAPGTLTATVLAPALKAPTASILAVDDDADFLANLVDILTELGHEVDQATSAESGLELAKQHRYDVALLDLKLPKMDGLSLCSRLKELQPAVTSLMISGFPDDMDIQQADSAGVAHVLFKPVDCHRLTSLIQDITRRN